MKKVTSFETADHALFTDEAAATTHQTNLDIRGLIQSNTLGKIERITPENVATFILNHGEQVAALLSKYRADMKRIGNRVKK